MNRQEFTQRINKLLAEEAKEPLRWWYLSYAKEEGFQGAIIIQAHGMVEACYLSKHRNISPGGEVWCHPIPDEHLPAPEHRNRLLTKAELDEIFGGQLMTTAEIEEFEKNRENNG